MGDGISASVDLENMQYPLKLKDVYQNHSQYPSFQWLCLTGEVLREGTQYKQGLIVNINKNHWVAVVFDLQDHFILYSDSKQLQTNCTSRGWLLMWAIGMECIGGLFLPHKVLIDEPCNW